MDYADLLKKASLYVMQYMSDHGNPSLIYHTLDHTRSVVRAAKEIGEHYSLTQQDFTDLIIAAWFHDLGYYESITEHEAVGAAKAAEFVLQNGGSKDVADRVSNLILATKLPQRPTTLMEEIICDADLFHLGNNDFKHNNELMWKEYSAIKNIHISWLHWQHGTLKLFELHTYHTAYCKEKLNPGKQKNLETLKSEINTIHQK